MKFLISWGFYSSVLSEQGEQKNMRYKYSSLFSRSQGEVYSKQGKPKNTILVSILGFSILGWRLHFATIHT